MGARNVFVFTLLLAVLFEFSAFSEVEYPDYHGVPYSYGDFNGSTSLNTIGVTSVYGDFNGDGYLEHVIGDPTTNSIWIYGCDSSLGRTYENCGCTGNYWNDLDRINPHYYGIYSQDSEYWVGGCREEFDSTYFPSPTPSSLGSSLAVGDFDGDGIDDLAIGAVTTNISGHASAGAVYIMKGNDQSFPADIVSVYQGKNMPRGTILGTAENSDRFGDTIVSADFNCDGIDDLAIGVPQEDVTLQSTFSNAGVVHILYGASGGNGVIDGFTPNHMWDESSLSTDYPASNEFFGASLATGRFNNQMSAGRNCYSLAVGAPGENYGAATRAGEAYAFYGQAASLLSPTRKQVLNEAVGAIADTPESNDMFAATMGYLWRYKYGIQYDGLWIGLSRQDFQCTQIEHRSFHRLSSGGAGIEIGAYDATYGGWLSPLIVQQRGVISEIDFPPYGPWSFYLPTEDDINGYVVMIHGAYGDSRMNETPPVDCDGFGAPQARFAGNEGLMNRIADVERYGVITPEVNHDYFGNHSKCMSPCSGDCETHGGYRGGNFGGILRNVGGVATYMGGLDYMMLRIANELDKVDGTVGTAYNLRLFGHSAGAQFISRFLWENYWNVESVVISSAGSFLWPDHERKWADGMDVFDDDLNFPQFSGPWHFTYDPEAHIPGLTWQENWGRITDLVDIHVVIGELETGAYPPGDPHYDPAEDLVLLSEDWVNDVSAIESVTNPPTLCVIEGGDHGSTFDTYVSGPPAIPVVDYIDYYGDEAAWELFYGGVNTTGYCL